MATIVYLDAEDEITSAAARIRQSADRRVALVIPFGSRVATSRINFRLLARESMTSGRRLDIVAPDASARALAASAGLPVFASVAEYEEALDAPPAEDGEEAVQPGPAGGAGAAAGLAAAGLAGSGSQPPAAGSGSQAPAPAPRPEPAPPAPGPDDHAARDAELDAIVHRSREVPVVHAPRRRPSAALVAGLLLLVAGLVAAGVAAVVLLPSADITVTPHVEPVGPLEMVVTADPAATAVDVEAGVIPAQTVDVPVAVEHEFEATGRRVETTPASGGVRWRNCDPSASYTIPKGTTVRTADGVEFSIDESVFLPVAVISGGGANVQLRCQSSEVAVTAAKPGPGGNVDAGTIRVVPARYNRNLITVTNPAATSGGTREEFTRVSRQDVAAALATLQDDLEAQFEATVEDPPDLPPGTTVFPDTGRLGEATPTVDPATLVNEEVETFTLGLDATGTVLAVDGSPIEAIAAAALEDAVSPGYQLVDGSTRVAVGDGAVRGDVVEFPVAGVAKQVRPLDAEALRRQVLGLTEDEARAALEPYGDVRIELWPDMVTTIPTLDQRVTLVVLDAVDERPDAVPEPATLEPATPSAPPVEGGDPSEPVPSG